MHVHTHIYVRACVFLLHTCNSFHTGIGGVPTWPIWESPGQCGASSRSTRLLPLPLPISGIMHLYDIRDDEKEKSNEFSIELLVLTNCAVLRTWKFFNFHCLITKFLSSDWQYESSSLYIINVVEPILHIYSVYSFLC